MMPSRGMGAVAPSKMPKAKRVARRDNTDFTEYAKGGEVGLYANINAKHKSGEKMRSPGQKGAPTAQDFIDSAKTAKRKKK